MTNRLLSYLRVMFGDNVELRDLSGNERRMAGWAVNFYSLFRSSIGGKDVLFAIAKGASRLTPSAVSRQMTLIGNSMDMSVIYVPAEVSAHDVPRLMARRIPFVVPDKAVFLPRMGVAIERRPGTREIVRETFSIVAQLISIGAMLGKIGRRLSIGNAAEVTGYSTASAVHACQELVHFGLCERICQNGRDVEYALREPAELWELGRNRFVNPCKREIGVDVLPDGAVEAGESALSTISELNPPETPTFAFPIKGFRSLGIEERDRDNARYRLQLWHYPPAIFGNGKIDRISLALSLHDNPDDRIQMAIEDAMGAFKW